jgi:hypothetical protein
MAGLLKSVTQHNYVFRYFCSALLHRLRTTAKTALSLTDLGCDLGCKRQTNLLVSVNFAACTSDCLR